MKKIIVIIIILSFLCFNIKLSANEDLIPNAKSGILIEETSGKVLYEKNSDTSSSPASMTKIMTLLLIFEAIEDEIIEKDDILITSNHAASMGGSEVYLEPGEEISVDELIKCICIASANDCAVLLAEEICGSEKAFVEKMNDRAKELGCKNTNFVDCTGLTEKNHYTTAYDLALIAKELVVNYPDVLNYTNIREDYIRKDTDDPFWLVNTNKMIGKVKYLDGLKTGYTSFSKYCISLHMKKNDMGLISIVFGYENSAIRNQESLELLNYGYNNYKVDYILRKGQIINSMSHILYKNNLDIVVKEDLTVISKKNDNNQYNYSYTYDIVNNMVNLKYFINDKEYTSDCIEFSQQPERKSFLEIIYSVLEYTFIR